MISAGAIRAHNISKKLEKGYCDAAYATFRSFALKFEVLGLLSAARYGSGVKYRVIVY